MDIVVGKLPGAEVKLLRGRSKLLDERIGGAALIED